MTIISVDHLEICTSDHAGTLDHLAGMGFRTMGAAQHGSDPERTHTTTMASGQAVMKVTTPLAEEGRAGAFLATHGDGVSDIALICDSVPEVYTRAVEQGAVGLRPPQSNRTGASSAVLEAFGDVRHTLVEAPSRELGAGRPGAMRGVDHIAVALASGSLEETAERYQRALDLQHYSAEYIEVGGQAMDSIVVRSPTGGLTLTLVEQDDSREPGQVETFIKANSGPGVQHIAFAVDDIVTEVRALRARGIGFLSTPDTYYDRLGERGIDIERVDALREASVLVDRDEWGTLLQIFTRSPFPRSTLFYELIERRDARGFGSANIKALYEAVERAYAEQAD